MLFFLYPTKGNLLRPAIGVVVAVADVVLFYY